MRQRFRLARELNRSKPCSVHLWYVEGTREYALSMALRFKLDEIKSVLSHGKTEAGVAALLDDMKLSKQQLRSQLAQALSSTGFDAEGWDDLFDDEGL
ncbi:MAG: hypothetical protein AAFV29_23195 [Myxococcota bacterium]